MDHFLPGVWGHTLGAHSYCWWFRNLALLVDKNQCTYGFSWCPKLAATKLGNIAIWHLLSLKLYIPLFKWCLTNPRQWQLNSGFPAPWIGWVSSPTGSSKMSIVMNGHQRKQSKSCIWFTVPPPGEQPTHPGWFCYSISRICEFHIWCCVVSSETLMWLFTHIVPRQLSRINTPPSPYFHPIKPTLSPSASLSNLGTPTKTAVAVS